ncbi:MAG: hypothetical protein ACO2ZZ_14235 [Cyclobacteriaceae bacterium]
MENKSMTNDCNSCTTSKTNKISTGSSLFSALMVVIIPKCPICIMAYTSAVTMCGGPDMYMAENNWISFIPIFMSLVITGLILYNRKGWRTWLALAIAMLGGIFIAMTHQLILPAKFYNVGTILLFLAIWFNSNFISFLGELRNFFNNSMHRA